MRVAQIFGKSSDLPVGTEMTTEDGLVYTVIMDKNGNHRWMKKDRMKSTKPAVKAVDAVQEKVPKTKSQKVAVKYVVVQTGYTSRLVDRKFKTWSKENGVLCVKDALWAGTSKLKAGGIDHTREELEEVAEFLNKNDLDGVAVFKVDKSSASNDYDDYVYPLGSRNYCSFCAVETIYERKKMGAFYVISVDCESG